MPRPHSKYKSRKIEADGETFDSTAEYRRYRELLIMQRAGLISELTRQVPFELAPAVKINGRTKPALRYVADYGYVDVATGQRVVEDKKGMLTKEYIIKRHLMKHIHGIDILET